ncbi:MAG TPA: twin-arginine translocase subunit TatC [Longimicrobiales bacterium]|nr:twin-arginine translocase subunit TatC [Longimicrobiales bacterium]
MKVLQARSPTGEMPFLDHLEELRWRIIWSLVAVVSGAVIGFVFVYYLPVLDWLSQPIQPFLNGEKLMVLTPAGSFMITVKLGLWVGIILAAPVVIYQVWAFVSPALLPHEKRAIVPALYFGLLLFAAGVALAYFFVLPLSLRFLASFQVDALEYNIVATEYLSFVVQMLLAFGLMFELPIVILVLAVLGIVNSKMLASGRRYALVLITIGACVVTPGDVSSSIFLMLPLLLLYEVSIWLARMIERRRAAAAAEDAWSEASWAAE